MKNVTVDFDAIQLVLECFADLYPEKTARIVWADLGKVKAAENEYPENETPIIRMDFSLPYRHVPEILSNALAHVVAGKPSDLLDMSGTTHAKVWDMAFNRIHREYVERFEKITAGERIIKTKPLRVVR